MRGRHVALGILGAIIVAALLITGVGRAAGFAKLSNAFEEGDFRWLAVCFVGEAVVFVGYAGAVRYAFASHDMTVPTAASIQLVFASFAATQLFAFAGVGGLAVIFWAFRQVGMSRSQATVRLIGLNTAVYLAFGTIGWYAALWALLTNVAPLGLTLPWLAGFPLIILLARWFTEPQRADRWNVDHPRLRRRALAVGVGAATWTRQALVDRSERPIFVWIACYWLGDIASLWAALRAFDASPGLPTVALAYVTGYLAQSLPIPLIATAGVDASTAFLLQLLGVPLDLALAGVLTHRFFAFWLPVIPGTVYALTLPRLGRRLSAQPGVARLPRDRVSRPTFVNWRSNEPQFTNARTAFVNWRSPNEPQFTNASGGDADGHRVGDAAVGAHGAELEVVREHTDVQEVDERVGDGGEASFGGASSSRPRTRHDVRDAVDRHAALVVVIMPRQHQLHTVPLEDRSEGLACSDARTLVAGRVRRVVHRHDLPRRSARRQGVLEERQLIGVGDGVRVETDDQHVTEGSCPVPTGHAERLHLLGAVPLVMVAEDRQQLGAAVEHRCERSEHGLGQPVGVAVRVDVVSQQQQSVELGDVVDRGHCLAETVDPGTAVAHVARHGQVQVGRLRERHVRLRRAGPALPVREVRDDLTSIAEERDQCHDGEDADDPQRPPPTTPRGGPR